jgi:hypothetical protein
MMFPSWMLSVQTVLRDQLELEYRDRALLVSQLKRFQKRSPDPFALNEFRNEVGGLIAFLSKVYLSHRVEPPHADFC